jgi:hypothetical protein
MHFLNRTPTFDVNFGKRAMESIFVGRANVESSNFETIASDFLKSGVNLTRVKRTKGAREEESLVSRLSSFSLPTEVYDKKQLTIKKCCSNTLHPLPAQKSISPAAALNL